VSQLRQDLSLPKQGQAFKTFYSCISDEEGLQF